METCAPAYTLLPQLHLPSVSRLRCKALVLHYCQFLFLPVPRTAHRLVCTQMSCQTPFCLRVSKRVDKCLSLYIAQCFATVSVFISASVRPSVTTCNAALRSVSVSPTFAAFTSPNLSRMPKFPHRAVCRLVFSPSLFQGCDAAC